MNDGGPAYPPSVTSSAWTGDTVYHGMSLRQAYAKDAMKGIYSNDRLIAHYLDKAKLDEPIAKIVAKQAFVQADAMLAEGGAS